MILYHASTVKIDQFYIPYGGLHIGGIHSALEAALRKLISPLNVVNADMVYLHKCSVDLGRIQYSKDLGGDDAWRTLIEECQRFGFESVEYKNEYEFDIQTSFMIWDTTRIQLLDVDPIHRDEAEMIIEDFLDEHDPVLALGGKV